MIKVLCIVIIFYNSLSANDNPDMLFLKANNYIVNQKYDKAIKIYENIIESGFESSDLYYNLGNAYYRKDSFGMSIWAYLSALKLDPRNEDINYNLLIAQNHTKDRIEMPGTIFFVDKYRYIKSKITLYEIVLLGSIICLMYSFIFMGLRFKFFKSRFIMILNQAILIIFIFVIVITLDKYFQIKNNKVGVVISSEVDAYSGPEYGQNVIIFRINEGSIVNIEKTITNWIEVALKDGKKGWVLSKSIRMIK